MKGAITLLALVMAVAAHAQSPEEAPSEAASEPLAAAEEPGRSEVQRPAPTASAASRSEAVPPRGAMDRLDLGTTSITGTQELPKVLHIVPWKRTDLGDLVGRPVNPLLDEVLAPLDPEVFERHLNYYDALYGESHEE